MDLSVIIVSYKGWERLTRCLDKLCTFTGSRFSMEVIVVDNHSLDDTFIKIQERFPHVIFLRNPVNGGFANGCNVGTGSATGEFLLFLNPDTIAAETEIEKLLMACRSDPGNYVHACRQLRENGKENRVAGSFPGLWNMTGFLRLFDRKIRNYYSSGATVFPDWVSGSVMMIRREIYNKINGFDEDFWMYSEDVDLCRRIKDIGGGIAYHRDIVVVHHHGGSSRVNLSTASVTKCEVLISKHVYNQKHKKGAERFLIHSFMIVNNFFTTSISGMAGIIMFFIPVLVVRVLVFSRLLSYYQGVLTVKSWISPRSVNSKKTVNIRP